MSTTYTRLSIIILFVLLSQAIMAIPVSQEQARDIANQFILEGSRSEAVASTIDLQGIYMFNLEACGFIAVSGDDQLPPILSYSYRNMLIQEADEYNPFVEIMREDIRRRLEYYNENPSAAVANQELWQSGGLSRDPEATRDQWPVAGSTPTDGWVETTWHQTGIYNDYCPLDYTGARSVVGCVATAMSMIMDYFGYIGNVSFVDTDDYTYGTIYIDDGAETNDFPTFPELNVLLDEVKLAYAMDTPLTNSNKAALCFAGGISVEMMYSSQGSGAYTSDVASAFVNRFHYNNAHHYDGNVPYFYNMLQQNLMNAQPTELSILRSDYTGGHAIICDGYNTND
ncbi:MAG: C10 family peptidase [Candidatus Cloacimonetes bacterium]|nr:C10 family peptidase [Candidatus Cloacimonadota bacterium]